MSSIETEVVLIFFMIVSVWDPGKCPLLRGTYSFIRNVLYREVVHHTQIVLNFKMSTEKEVLKCKYRGLLGPDEAVPIRFTERQV